MNITKHSRSYELSLGNSLAKVGHGGCKVYYALKRREQLDLLLLFFYIIIYFISLFLLATKVNNTKC